MSSVDGAADVCLYLRASLRDGHGPVVRWAEHVRFSEPLIERRGRLLDGVLTAVNAP